mmetsp:Transcript_6410/g.6618  ORF Transcript_6410/g.6618 Transcript_6410/m.6618 type:complete len:835 (-) Transcript_6410:70-2574(-)
MIPPEELQYLEAPDIEPVKSFLLNAFDLKSKGEALHYLHLVKQLQKRDDPDTVWKVYIALCCCVHEFTTKPEAYRDLLSAIFGFDWFLEKKVIVAFENLLKQIVSANTVFLVPTLKMLIRCLGTDKGENTEIDRDERVSRLHSFMKSILTLVPSGKAELIPIISDNFPHRRFPVSTLTNYVTQIFRICEYAPALQARLLGLVISHCLEIDVEIAIEDTGLVKLSVEQQTLPPTTEQSESGKETMTGEQQAVADMFTMDDMTGAETEHDSDGKTQIHTHEEERTQQISARVAEMADKLDALLSLLIHFIHSNLSPYPVLGPSIGPSPGLSHSGSHQGELHNSSSDSDLRLFLQLLEAFEERILTTHKSKFVQFIIFTFCARSQRLAILFARRLLQLFLDPIVVPTPSALKKQSAVMYLASYAARARYLSSNLVSDIVTELISWADAYVTATGVAIMPSLSMPSSFPLEKQSEDREPYNEYQQSSSLKIELEKNNSNRRRVSGRVDGQFLLQDLDEYGRAREKTRSRMTTDDMIRHETFLYCVQALCYILCFHGEQLAARQRSSPAKRYSWERVLSCRLVPLRFCLQSVREEFFRLARHTHLLSEACWALLPPDLSGMPSKSASSSHTVPSRMGRGPNPLDSFFPFDPCLLHSVYEVVEPDYRWWCGVPGLDVEDDVMIEGEEEREDEREENHTLLYNEGEEERDVEEESWEENMSMSSSYSFASRGDAHLHTPGTLCGSYNRIPGSHTHQDTPGSVLSTSLEMDTWIEQSNFHAHGQLFIESEKKIAEVNGGNLKYRDEEEEEDDEDYSVLKEENKESVPYRRPRQFSISSVGSW